MDLRLLYGIAYGHTWFGRWGYKFCRGSFGVTEYKYDRAIETLSFTALDQIISGVGNRRRGQEITRITRRYRDLCETQLITLKDLLRFMLTLKSLAMPSSASLPPGRTTKLAKPLVTAEHDGYGKFAKKIAKNSSCWSIARIEKAAKAVVGVLKEMQSKKIGNGGIGRSQLRDAAREYIGDTGLLDFTMEVLNNENFGNDMVSRAVNPSTRVLEYAVRDWNGTLVKEPKSQMGIEQHPASILQLASVISNDLVYIYADVLLGYPELGLCEWPSGTVLDSKHFVKEWSMRDDESQSLRFICHVMPSSSEFARDLLPGELIVVPMDTTIDDLKEAAQRAMRDTYCIMEGFKVKEVVGMEGMGNREAFYKGISEVWVRGVGIDWSTNLRYEGGTNNWTVRCVWYCGR